MILGLLFTFKPFLCPGCGDASAHTICDSCFRSLKKNHEMLATQSEGIRGIFPVFYSFSTTHKILVYWKDHGGNELRSILFTPSKKLKQQLLQMDFDLVIPIPQQEKRSLKRGHASAFEVARFFADQLQLPFHSDILKLKKTSEPGVKQANLTAWERKYSENPFGVKSLPAPEVKKILVVDDFITSGSTLDKAANALLAVNPNLLIYAASLGWKPKMTKSLTK